MGAAQPPFSALHPCNAALGSVCARTLQAVGLEVVADRSAEANELSELDVAGTTMAYER